MKARLAGSLGLARNVELAVSKRATTTLVSVHMVDDGYRVMVAQKLFDDFRYSEVVEMVNEQLDAVEEAGHQMRAR